MRKALLLLCFVLIAAMDVAAQRMSTQQFLVRKVTFQATDQIVPIGGITVEINKANFRSDKAGQFTANIPVAKDMGFYISKITAPGYIVSIPEDLSKKIYLSANKCVIVLADINAVKAERNRIYSNNKAALAKQEARLNAEVKKNQSLLKKYEHQQEEYNAVLAELAKTKQQLEAFVNAKTDLEEKIDSLSDALSLVDYASLESDEQARIEKEKNGEWLDVIVDEVISKLQSNLNVQHGKEIEAFAKLVDDVADEYYKAFIKDNDPFAARYYFSRVYGDYLRYRVEDHSEKKDDVLDRILSKIVEEDMEKVMDNNVERCLDAWKVEDADAPSYVNGMADARTLESAKKEFMSHAMYPDKEEALRSVMHPKWYAEEPDESIVKTLKRVYPEFYKQCKKTADMCAKNHDALTDEDLRNYYRRESRASLYIDLETEVRRALPDNIEAPFYTFREMILGVAVQESLEFLRTKYNSCIDKAIEEVEKQKWTRIDKLIPSISEAKHSEKTQIWDKGKYYDSDKEKYESLTKEYPEYAVFLSSIVMEFMQPIIDKYDCEEALYTSKSALDADVNTYCYRAIRNYDGMLSRIPDVKGSDRHCEEIVRVIIEMEKGKIVDSHNQRIADMKNAYEESEKSAIAHMKTGKTRFDNETDVIGFLATHKFVNADYRMAVWYDSKLTQWCMDFGQGDVKEDISYIIKEWNANSAKIEMNLKKGGMPVIINVTLEDGSASYSESCGGMTRSFTVEDK